VVADRRRIELVDDEWAKQPYHAVESLPVEEAVRTLASFRADAERRAYDVTRTSIIGYSANRTPGSLVPQQVTVERVHDFEP